MLNDTLADCTCAAFYHAIQVWTSNTGQPTLTEPDSDVQQLYMAACGYNPRVPGSGPGGNVQDVLTYLLQQGAPMGPDGQARHKITAFVEVDARVIDDVKRTINDCGLAYVGFNVPQNIKPPIGVPPTVWDVDPSDPPIVDLHTVILVGYDAAGAKAISCGKYYTMTWSFFSRYTDEVYAIADSFWFTTRQTTPGGLTLDELQAQMQALQED